MAGVAVGVLLSAGVAGLLLVDGGDPGPPSVAVSAESAAAAPTTAAPTTGSTRPAPRLRCPGAVETFRVTGAPLGSTLPTFTTAEDAVRDVQQRRGVDSFQVVGADPDGIRFVLLDGSAAVEEVVVRPSTAGSWRPVLYSTCA